MLCIEEEQYLRKQIEEKNAEIAALKSKLGLAALGEGEAMSMFEDAEARVIRQNAEIAVLRYELLSAKTAKDDADNAVTRLKEEIAVTVDVLKQVQEERDGLKERVRELEAERRTNALDGQAAMDILGNENTRLREALEKYQAFWEDARMADKMTWEQYEWPKHQELFGQKEGV